MKHHPKRGTAMRVAGVLLSAIDAYAAAVEKRTGVRVTRTAAAEALLRLGLWSATKRAKARAKKRTKQRAKEPDGRITFLDFMKAMDPASARLVPVREATSPRERHD